MGTSMHGTTLTSTIRGRSLPEDRGSRGQPVAGVSRDGDAHTQPERHAELMEGVHQP
jgi:hypothetical protein